MLILSLLTGTGIFKCMVAFNVNVFISNTVSCYPPHPPKLVSLWVLNLNFWLGSFWHCNELGYLTSISKGPQKENSEIRVSNIESPGFDIFTFIQRICFLTVFLSIKNNKSNKERLRYLNYYSNLHTLPVTYNLSQDNFKRIPLPPHIHCVSLYPNWLKMADFGPWPTNWSKCGLVFFSLMALFIKYYFKYNLLVRA